LFLLVLVLLLLLLLLCALIFSLIFRSYAPTSFSHLPYIITLWFNHLPQNANGTRRTFADAQELAQWFQAKGLGLLAHCELNRKQGNRYTNTPAGFCLTISGQPAPIKYSKG